MDPKHAQSPSQLYSGVRTPGVMRSELSFLQGDLQVKAAQVAELTQLVEEQGAEIERLQLQLERARENREREQGLASAKLRETISQFDETEALYKRVIERLQLQYRELQGQRCAEGASLRPEVSAPSYEREAQEGRKTIDKLRWENAQLTVDFGDAQKQLAGLSELRARQNALEETHREVFQQKCQAEQETDRLRTEVERTHRKLAEQTEIAEEQRAKIQAARTELELALAETHAAEARLRDHEAALFGKEEEIEARKMQYAQLAEKNDALHGRVEELTAHVQRQQEALHQAQELRINQFKETQAVTAQAKQSYFVMANVVAETASQMHPEDLETLFTDRLTQIAQRVNAVRLGMASYLTHSDHLNTWARESVERLKEQLSQTETHKQALLTELQQTRDEMGTETQLNRQLRGERDTLKAELEILSKKLEAADAELADLRQGLQTARDTVAQGRDAVRELAEKLALTQGELAQAQHRLGDKTTEAATLQRREEELSSALAQAKQDAAQNGTSQREQIHQLTLLAQQGQMRSKALQTQLDAAQARIRALEEAEMKTQEAKKTLHAQLNTTVAEKAALGGRLVELERAYQQQLDAKQKEFLGQQQLSQLKLQTIEQQNTQFERDLLRERQASERLKQEIRQLQERERLMQGMRMDDSARSSNTQNEADAYRQANNALREQVTKLQLQQVEAAKTIELQRMELERLSEKHRRDAKAHLEEKDALLQSLDSLKRRFEDMRAQIDAEYAPLQSQLRGKERELESVRQRLSDTQLLLDSRTEEVRRLNRVVLTPAKD